MRTQNQIYGVTLPVHVAQRAQAVATTKGKSRSALMRELLIDYLKRYEDESEPSSRIKFSPIQQDPTPTQQAACA